MTTITNALRPTWSLANRLLPFLPGEAAKIAIAATALPLTWRAVAHR